MKGAMDSESVVKSRISENMIVTSLASRLPKPETLNPKPETLNPTVNLGSPSRVVWGPYK